MPDSIALDAADPRLAAYLALPRPLPAPGVDAAGRALPVAQGQESAYAEAIGRALDQIAEITDETDTPETWGSVLRSIDEGRPHRKLFEGMY